MGEIAKPSDLTAAAFKKTAGWHRRPIRHNLDLANGEAGFAMARLVNLDAMIQREDFEVDQIETPRTRRPGNELKLSELESSGIIFHTLRKPDFQRETASWDVNRVVEFIKSFIDGDLIPAVIMWRSQKTGNIFVIDGAHRLSALIAWIHDDYGDQTISRPFFQGMIEAPQQKSADDARSRISSELGTYQNLKQYAFKPDAAPDAESLRRARDMGSAIITLQWVEGDAESAQRSFFKINQSSARIEETELALIHSRRKPNAIATRALIRAGTGHKYWSNFDAQTMGSIESVAKAVYDNLFLPVLEYPIKTLDLPAADRGYTADSVAMIFDLVNYMNGIPEANLPDDHDGSATLSLLRKVEKAASRVFGPAPGSLGLHPGVYCYGATGRFQSIAFLAAIAFVQELDKRRQFQVFISQRAKFEEFLIRYRYFINQINKNYSRAGVALRPVVLMYDIILEGMIKNWSDDQIIERMKEEKSLKTIKIATEEDRKYGRNFTRETKNAGFLREALSNALLCKICGARLHFKAISHDHKVRRADGGLGSLENNQLTHPYCNTGYKEKVTSSK